MADAEADLIQLPERKPIPPEIAIQEGVAPTPNEMRAIKAASGHRLETLLGDAGDLDDKMQALVWLALRRAGFDPTWDEAGDVRPLTDDDVPDPTNAGR